MMLYTQAVLSTMTGSARVAAIQSACDAGVAQLNADLTRSLAQAQVRLVRDTYGIAPGEVDFPLLPIFALFNPALGMTTIVPELDPCRPAALDPARAVRAIPTERRRRDLDCISMLDWLRECGVPHTVIATKLDKVKPSKLATRKRDLSKGCGLDPGDVFWVSSSKGDGIESLAKHVTALLTLKQVAGVAAAAAFASRSAINCSMSLRCAASSCLSASTSESANAGSAVAAIRPPIAAASTRWRERPGLFLSSMSSPPY